MENLFLLAAIIIGARMASWPLALVSPLIGNIAALGLIVYGVWYFSPATIFLAALVFLTAFLCPFETS